MPLKHLKYLFKSLDRRKQPEDIAARILMILGNDLSPSEKDQWQASTPQESGSPWPGHSSLAEDFQPPVGMRRQIRKALDLFVSAPNFDKNFYSQPEEVRKFIHNISQEIHKDFGANDFKHDRLSRIQRQNQGLDLSRRKYNKLFRHLKRLEEKLRILELELKKLSFRRMEKSGLAYQLDWETFSSDVPSACFIAYYTALCNQRPETAGPAPSSFPDAIARLLFARCLGNAQSTWWAIAHVCLHEEVISRLTDKHKGKLIGRWFGILSEIADLLATLWESSALQRDTMTARPGNDSSSWNHTANAWNNARLHWIALLRALNLQTMLTAIYLGKVQPLSFIKAETSLSKTNAASKNDWLLWLALPLPWEVLRGRQICSRQRVENQCARQRIDPASLDWPAPQTSTDNHPSPTLIQVIKEDAPALINLLKAHGYFPANPG
ncbi:MAG: hypothetical protein HC880_12035 [Bacteroidia bacterium]|nr:hypothetical protein [Bacteroidia bacterium]